MAKFLPWVLLGAFVVLAWWLFGDRFESRRAVELYKVVSTRASGDRSGEPEAENTGDNLDFESRALFQASGWIENDPLPIRVTTLYSGVVDEVHVLQGQNVEVGQVIATMVAEDAELDLATSRAALAAAEAEHREAESRVVGVEAASGRLDREIRAAKSRLAELTDEADRLERAGRDVFRESQITQAALRVATQEQTVEALNARMNELEASRSGAEFALDAAAAHLEQARVEVSRRQLALERTKVRSPVAGRIQELYAAPGMKRMLNMDGLETATIAKVYRPDALQARIDVPLEEAAQLSIGQPVRLRSSLLPNRSFRGQVTRIDGVADLQRNTLQAKVRLLDPEDQLRPEMLCRAEFLPAKAQAGKAGGDSPRGQSRVELYVPEEALVGEGQARSVWALGASGESVELRSVQLGSGSREGYRPVFEGLRPGDWVVLNPPADLKPGEPVRAKVAED
ncbi:MAG: efflux RND transporter periplasmic adaptor subunit [Opitutales bacterium]